MSKKHFIALADALRGTRPTDPSKMDQWKTDVDAIADFCRSQNSQFMKGRWLGYINGENGPGGGSIKA